MAIALIGRICDLFPEFLADALIVLAALQTAGAVTAGTLQTFLNGLYHFLIFIQPNSHIFTSLPCYYRAESEYVNYKTFRIQEG